jgi:uncharacterized membrane protein YkvA (DUF1232 family)
VTTRERHGRETGGAPHDSTRESHRESHRDSHRDTARGDPRDARGGGDHRPGVRGGPAREKRPAGASNGARRGAANTVLQGLRHIPAYLRLLGGLLFDARVATLDKVLVIGAIAFVLSPADIIPNMIPVLGELDDLFILTLALQHLVAHADEEVLRDHWAGDPEELTQLSVGRMMAAVSFFLPVSVRGAIRRRLARRRRR